jgi:hypothetical protein
MSSTLALPAVLQSQSTLRARLVPSSWMLLWELPFWLIFGFGALVPATLVSREEWFGVPMKVSDMLTILGASFYGCSWLVQIIIRRRWGGAKNLILSTLLLLAYGAVRLSMGSLEGEDQLAMGFALLLALAAPIQAAGIFSLYNPVQAMAFVNRLVLFLACVSLLYTAESVLGLGLRSEAAANLVSDFGIQRVRGPLFGASTGYFLLLPAIGWSMKSFLDPACSRAFATFCTISLLGAFLGMGSRAGLILLVVFISGLVLLLRYLKRSEGTALLLALACLGVGFLVYAQADTQRLTQFEDTHRRLTHETAANIIEAEPLQTLIAGQGYGTIWPWYRRDTLRTDSVANGDNTISTGFGHSLYHSHSTLLELVIEFGIAGICWLVYTGFQIGKLPFEAESSTTLRIFTLSLLVSLLSFGFDLFLFKEVRVNAVWWLFAVAAFQLPRNTEGNLA